MSGAKMPLDCFPKIKISHFTMISKGYCLPWFYLHNSDWCLFIDSSITSLKTALMYKSNLYPTLPICYGNVKEKRSSIKKILELINYESHQWLVMCDLKVLNIIMGLTLLHCS